MAKRSVELREQAKAKHDAVGEVLRLAGETRDFSKKEVLEKLGATDSADAVKRWRALADEAHALHGRAVDAEVDEEVKAFEVRDEELKNPKHGNGNHPAPESTGAKTLGRLFVESKGYEDWRAKARGARGQLNVELDIELKTLLTTTAGFAPDSPRTADVVPFATRPIQVLDFIPIEPVSVQIVKWMEKTTFTVGAVEIAEAAAYPEPTYVWTERTSPVQKIAVSLPVTDEQLEDVDQMASLVDGDLRLESRQRLDGQVINGNGTPPNLRGILNVAGIQTQARGTDPHFDAVFKALTKVRATGRAEPDVILIHSTDWQTFRLMRTADGIYIMGNPADPGSNRLFGVPTGINEVLSAGTALTGDFARYSRLKERKGLEVEVGYVGDNFKEGKKTFRAQLRAALVCRRAAAFCSITGL
jgi:HK97 family phage major capsid protein